MNLLLGSTFVLYASFVSASMLNVDRNSDIELVRNVPRESAFDIEPLDLILDREEVTSSSSLLPATSRDHYRSVIRDRLNENEFFEIAFETEELRNQLIVNVLGSWELIQASGSDLCAIISAYKALNLNDYGQLSACLFKFINMQPSSANINACRASFIRDAVRKSFTIDLLLLWKEVGKYCRSDRFYLSSSLAEFHGVTGQDLDIYTKYGAVVYGKLFFHPAHYAFTFICVLIYFAYGLPVRFWLMAAICQMYLNLRLLRMAFNLYLI